MNWSRTFELSVVPLIMALPFLVMGGCFIKAVSDTNQMMRYDGEQTAWMQEHELEIPDGHESAILGHFADARVVRISPVYVNDPMNPSRKASYEVEIVESLEGTAVRSVYEVRMVGQALDYCHEKSALKLGK